LKRCLAVGVAAIVLLALAPAAASAKGFKFGVTAGEITPTSAIMWTRADRAGRVVLEVSPKRRFNSEGVKLYVLRARASSDRTVQRKVGRLKPGRRYFYRFSQGRGRVARGTFATAPKPGANATIEFAWTGDSDATPKRGQKKPFWNDFSIFRRMQAERNDFNIHFGDTIYSDSEVPGRLRPIALSVKAKWAKYKVNLGQSELRNLRSSGGFYSHWDDHEFVNDFSPKDNRFSNGVKINGRTLYKRGVKAFRDYAPVSYTSRDGLYRTRRWGKNLELFFLDQRSFRSKLASSGGVCDNPETGEPDIAPTAPQATRNLFGIVASSLRQPVSQRCLDTIRSPSRTYLGKRQLARFLNAVKSSDARFKVIMNELPIQQYYALPYDRWEGYEAERQRVLKALSGKVKNLIFLTTDVHATLVNDARFQTLEPGGPKDSGILDVTVGSAATANFELEIDEFVGKGNGRLVDDVFLEGTPPNGPGMLCSEVAKFSYGEVKVTRNRLTVTPKGIDGKRLGQDPNGAQGGSTDCGPFVLNYQR